MSSKAHRPTEMPSFKGRWAPDRLHSVRYQNGSGLNSRRPCLGPNCWLLPSYRPETHLTLTGAWDGERGHGHQVRDPRPTQAESSRKCQGRGPCDGHTTGLLASGSGVALPTTLEEMGPDPALKQPPTSKCSVLSPIRELARLLFESPFYLVLQKRSLQGVQALAGKELGSFGEV